MELDKIVIVLDWMVQWFSTPARRTILHARIVLIIDNQTFLFEQEIIQNKH